MIKLYYSPGACSLAPHIALEETGAPFEAERIMLADGDNRKPAFLAINPTGFVPVLDVDGTIITENIAVLTYIARQHPDADLLPFDTPLALARCYRQMAFLSSSLHIAYAQAWRPLRFTADQSVHPAIVDGGRERVMRYNAEIDAQLGASSHFAGDALTLADFYLLVFYRFGNRLGVEMRHPNWQALNERLLARPAVQRVIAREGLDPADFLASRI